MVNADLATPLKANSGALVGETYRERERRLEKYAKDKFAPGEKEYAWVADFTDSQAVIILNNGDPKVYGYKSEAERLSLTIPGQRFSARVHGLPSSTSSNHFSHRRITLHQTTKWRATCL